MNPDLNAPIDVVFTWVDGGDKVHQHKMNSYINDLNKTSSIGFRTRYDQVNEIEYAVKSILKYAKFVRTIFIVTDQQSPSFIQKQNKSALYNNVKIVDHQTIFKGVESYLPVFNSIAIESLLHKIPGLAEQYIYFNDDFMLLKPVKKTDFFKNGFPVLRGQWKPFDDQLFYKKVKNYFLKSKKNKRQSFKKSQQNIAKELGFAKYFKISHTPVAFRKSTVTKYFDENPHKLVENIRHKFRHHRQFMVQSLANHLELKSANCTLIKDHQLLFFSSYKKPLFWIKKQLRTNDSNILFLCLQSLDVCEPTKLKYILSWLKTNYTIHKK